MKLEQLAAKPKLIEVIIDDADIVEEFGETISFYTWDRQPMPVFVKLAGVDQNNHASIMDAVKDLVLNEQGQPIIHNDITLPNKVLVRCITKIVESLGKL